MEKLHNCKTCRYYRPHYAKNDDGEFYEVDKEGHCANPDMGIMPFRRCIRYNYECHLWEETEQAETSESLRTVLSKMATRIEQIAAYLEIEE